MKKYYIIIFFLLTILLVILFFIYKNKHVNLASMTGQVSHANKTDALNWQEIYMSDNFACGIQENLMYCKYIQEQPVIGQKYNSYTTDIKDFDYKSLGNKYFCGIKKGELYCWLNKISSEFGLEKIKIDERKEWEKISSGYDHVCGILRGELYCWGKNTSGQLGVEIDKNKTVSKPLKIEGYKGWDNVFAGFDKTCGVIKGSLYCWGGFIKKKFSPEKIGENIINWKKISLGLSFDCGISREGGLYCWGLRKFYSTRKNDQKLSSVPERVVLIDENEKWEDISVNRNGLCGISKGIIYCWGEKLIHENQLTDNSENNVKIYQSNSKWDSLVMSREDICALKQGEVYCWGVNRFKHYFYDKKSFMQEPPFTEIKMQ